MTTALSPPSSRSIMMIWPTAAQSMLVRNSSMARVPRYPSEHALEKLAHLGRVLGDLDATGFHHRQLLLGGALATGDDGAGMAHALARRGGDAGDEADHRLLHVRLDPVGGFFLVAAADLADHDDRIGIRILVEELQDVGVLEAVDRVAADADGRGLSQAERGELADRLVGQGAGARYHPDAALHVDVARHDADLEFIGSDDTGAIGSEQQRLLAVAAHPVAYDDHVAHRDAFRDADDEVEIGVDRFPDRF